MPDVRAGKTEWVHAMAGGLSVLGAEGSVARSNSVPEAVILGKTNKKRITRYDLDVCNYCSDTAYFGIGLFPHCG